MKTTFPELTLLTLEDALEGRRVRPLIPEDNEPFSLFAIHDPFGVHMAIIPLFWVAADGDLQGLGTAFAVDPWGTFLTADHIIAFARQQCQPVQQVGPDYRVVAPTDSGLIGILGFGVVFGTIGLPQDAIVRVRGTWSPVIPGADPLLQLQGRPDFSPIDLAVVTMTKPAQKVHNLAVRRRAPLPEIGDVVVAIGYPGVGTFRGDQEEARTTIEEGMKVSYGRVTAILLEGRDQSNPTPVFQVEANWPPGMSGGPVFNLKGEVIGIVSRSYVPEDPDDLGTAWATCLGIIDEIPGCAPTLDPINPTWRRCWAVLSKGIWEIAGTFPTREEADQLQMAKGAEWEVRFGSWEIGTDNFMSTNIREN